MPATGGTPEVYLPVNLTTEVDFHHVATLPDNRVLVATHVRENDREQQELYDGVRRVVLTTDSNIGKVKK